MELYAAAAKAKAPGAICFWVALALGLWLEGFRDLGPKGFRVLWLKDSRVLELKGFSA